MAALGSISRPKKPSSSAMPSLTRLHTTILYILLLSLAAILLHHTPSSFSCSTTTTSSSFSSRTHFSGDLRDAEFSWNSLPFPASRPPPTTLRIAVFSRKWPVATNPGGMERHAFTLYSALSRRGHEVHVFTSSPSPPNTASAHAVMEPDQHSPVLHFLEDDHWRPEHAWPLFKDESSRGGPFDVVHTESVALPNRLARTLPNLAVSWHGISLEALHSAIYQDLTRPADEPMSPAFNRSLAQAIYKVLDEIRFFHSYAHHVAISDSTGDMLRDVYQIPSRRVHVILNGVDEAQFYPDPALGAAFRSEIGLPSDAALVLGVAGRLVKDKGHPLLYEAFSNLTARYPTVYLLVAGTGPWAQRYEDLGPNVVALGAVEPRRLRAFYNAVDLFVNPTLRPQGLDLTLMEAMQCGKPVLATRFPSIKGSIVVEEEFGFMFAPNAPALLGAMERAVGEGTARLARRGRACREYAREMFGATKMAMAYERLFLCIKDAKHCLYPLDFD